VVVPPLQLYPSSTVQEVQPIAPPLSQSKSPKFLDFPQFSTHSPEDPSVISVTSHTRQELAFIYLPNPHERQSVAALSLQVRQVPSQL
jgi:hypothetical protein